MGTRNNPIYENKEPIIANFLSDAYSDPTLLSFDFAINEHSIMFCEEDVVSPGSLFFWDDSSMLTDFFEGIGQVVATPHILLKNLNETSPFDISTNDVPKTNFRDVMWMKFIQGFKRVCKEQQWRIQSIDGIDSVFTNLNNYKDGYQGSGDDKITLTFLDDVELTMFHLFELYRNSVYDQLYKRQLIPNNLLKFDCVIEISDRRRLRSGKITQETQTTLGTPTTEKDIANFLSKYKSNSPLNSIKNTYLSTYEKTVDVYSEGQFFKPKISIVLCDCMFDLSSMSKSFDSINPSETDNKYSEYSICFKYGKALIRSNFIEEMGKWEKFKEEQSSQNKSSQASAQFYADNTSSRAGSLKDAIKNGFDGALNSAKQSGKDYLDNLQKEGERKLEQVKNKIFGKEQGYELGNNIYGESNFISAMGEKLGDKLTGLADELVNKAKSETIGKLNGLVGKGKAIVEGTLANAESSLMSGGQKGKSPSPNTLKPPKRSEAVNRNPEVEKLTGNERVYEENTSKNSDTFESFNIYQNTPSGPKQ